MSKIVGKLTLLIGINTLLFYVLDFYIFPEKFSIIGETHKYMFLGAVFGIFYAIAWPLLKLIAAPIRFLSMGIFGLFMSGILLWIFSSTLGYIDFPIRLQIAGAITHILAGWFFSAGNYFVHKIG